MRQYDKVALLEEELNDLKLRLDLSEADKKAYVETTQWTIKQNKEELAKLRSSNKQVSEEVSQLKKYDTNGDRKKTDIVSKLDQRVIDLNKRLDDLKATLKEKTDRLSNVQQSLEQTNISVSPDPQSNDESREDIVVLENKLDKVMIKFNEVTTIRKVYEQIIQALEDERNQFDQQLYAFERSLRVKRQDAHDLEQMAQDALRARDLAKAELAKFEMKIYEEKKQREKDILKLKEMIRIRRSNDERADKRPKSIMATNNVNDDISQDTKSDENQIEQQRERSENVKKMEETLRLVKEETGLSNISDLLNKMRTVQQTSEQLNSLRAQYEQKLAALKDQKSVFSSSSKDESSESTETKDNEDTKEINVREMVDSQEVITKQNNLVQLRRELADAKSKLEKLTKIMSHARLGVYQLYEKLDAVPVSLSQETSMQVPLIHAEKMRTDDETAQNAMIICVEKLSLIYKSLKEREETEGEIPLPSSTITKAILPEHNIRVGKIASIAVDESEDDAEGNDNQVLDRETIKRYTAQMLNARIKTKVGKKKKAKRGDDSD